MSEETKKPSKDIDPHIIDQPMLNNPKLALLFTDYQEIINLFPGESLAAFVRKYVDATHDPVTSEKNFYLGLNDTEIKLETIDNPNIDYEKIKSEAGLDTTKYPKQPEDAIDSFKLKDVVDVNVQIILYWVEKFRCIHETVKQEIWSEIPKEDEGGSYDNTNTYFNNFNESFFSIRDKDYIKDRSSLSYLIAGPREQYNKNMMGKIDMDTYTTAQDMSTKIDQIFHANMTQLCMDVDRDARVTWEGGVPKNSPRYGYNPDDLWLDSSKTQAETPKLAHGNNNVADSIHVSRIEEKNLVLAVQTKMGEILGDMKRVFDFLDKNNSDDIQEWGRWNHKILKDRVWMEVDQSLTELAELFSESSGTQRKNQDLS